MCVCVGGDLFRRKSQEGCNQLSVCCEVSQMGENIFFTSGNSTGEKPGKREEERGSERKRIRGCCSQATVQSQVCVCVCYEWRRRGVNVRLRVLLGSGGAPAGDGNPRLENKIKTGERCVHLERRVRPF